MNALTPPPSAQISFKGRAWVLKEGPRGAHVEIRNRGVDPLLAKIIAGRGIAPNDLQSFLNPTIRELMPDPFFLKDMDKAARRIAQAIRAKEPIGIWSDYDADGATSAAILGRFLRMVGHDLFTVRIPDRIREGYGPNTPGLLSMKNDQGFNLVCILDAGIVAFEPLSAAADAGMEIIVLDHHMAQDTLPPGVAIVNPNRKDQASGLEHLCAAGVTFLFAVAVARELRQSSYFDGAGGRPAVVPDLMELLDLVALGTICDVMQFKTLNRAFVKRGLTYLSKRATPGVSALALAAGIEPDAPITEKDCGWVLGPRINAGGRIGNSASGALLLLEEDLELARERAEALHQINIERRDIEKAATETAMAMMGARKPGQDRTLVLAVVDAHEGIVGISAGRLKEQFDAPAIVLTEDHDGNLKGSARSVAGFDIGHAIIEAAAHGHILKGGGHGMAGGLTLRRDQLDGFRAFMNAEIAKSAYFTTGVSTEADLSIQLPELTVASIQSLETLRPFGTGNPEPMVILRRVELSAIKILKEKHLKLTLKDGAVTIDGLMWNVVGTALGQEIQDAHGRMMDVIGTAGINEFRGKKSPQMILEDLRFHDGSLI